MCNPELYRSSHVSKGIKNKAYEGSMMLKKTIAHVLSEGIRHVGLPPWLSSKESACNAGDTGDVSSIPGLGRS